MDRPLGVVAILAALAASSVAAEPVPLVWSDVRTIVEPDRANRVRTEAVAALAAVGVDAAWVAEPEVPGPDLRYVAIVAKMPRVGPSGFCSGGRTVFVSPDAVRDSLGSARTSTGAPASLYLDVALGRAIAHEIMHSLRPGVGHGAYGLMAAKLSADGLVRPVELDPRWRAALTIDPTATVASYLPRTK